MSPIEEFPETTVAPGIGIVPSWHKGYMVREYVARFGHRRPTACLGLSFPALKGASGAPFIDERTGLVLGMIVGNTERVLLPTQIAPVTRGHATVDEVRYFAPYACAIMARYLRNAFEKCQLKHADIARGPSNPS